jgi:hypothetical protein
MRGDRTIERNYLRQWRMLIAQYEAVRAGRSTAFNSVRDFYGYHGTCSQTFRKYYNRYRASGLTTDLFPRRRGPKNREKAADAEASQEKEAVFKVLHSPPSDFGFNRSPLVRRISGSKKFSSSPKRTFATISTVSGLRRTARSAKFVRFQPSRPRRSTS